MQGEPGGGIDDCAFVIGSEGRAAAVAATVVVMMTMATTTTAVRQQSWRRRRTVLTVTHKIVFSDYVKNFM